MKRHRSPVISLLLLTVAVALCTACTGGFVGVAARSSFATFVNSVLTTGVNQALNPTD